MDTTVSLELKEKIQDSLKKRWGLTRFCELHREYRKFFRELHSKEDKLQLKDYHDRYSNKDRDKKLFPYVPIHSLQMFVSLSRIMHYAKRQKIDIKYFLDVGCGPGITLEIAELFGLKPFGIEISKITSEYAEEKFPQRIFVGNAFDFDFSQLEKTLIYTFMPIRSPELMMELGEKILKEIPDNCFWVEMYGGYHISKRHSFNERIIFYKEKDKEVAQLTLGLYGGVY